MDPSEFTVRAATRGAILAVLLTIILVACSGGAAPPASDAPTGAPPAPLTFDGLVSQLTDLDGSDVLVTGFLLVADGRAQLCGVLLESYPPQCGQVTLRVLGEVPAAVLDGLDTTNVGDPRAASWGLVQIGGVVDAGGDAPTITIKSIRIADPL